MGKLGLAMAHIPAGGRCQLHQNDDSYLSKQLIQQMTNEASWNCLSRARIATSSAYRARNFLNIASATLNSLSTIWYFRTNFFYHNHTDMMQQKISQDHRYVMRFPTHKFTHLHSLSW